jgi:hypothetical protein
MAVPAEILETLTNVFVLLDFTAAAAKLKVKFCNLKVFADVVDQIFWTNWEKTISVSKVSLFPIDAMFTLYRITCCMLRSRSASIHVQALHVPPCSCCRV